MKPAPKNRQVEVRDRLNTFIKTKGIIAKFVAEQCKVDPALLSRFRTGKRNLWDSTLQDIEAFLDENTSTTN